MAIGGSAFTGAPLAPVPTKQSFGDKVLGGVKYTAGVVSDMRTLYEVGKMALQVARYIPRIPL